MRNAFRDAVPSMFHRRLWLLAGCAMVVFLGLGAQLTRLTIAQASQLRDEAESPLVRHRLIPTVRGRILDRRGRILATDRPSYDISVHYELITGEWAYDQAEREARKMHRDIWIELGYTGRQRLIDRYLPTYEAQLDELWQVLCEVGEIDEAELVERKASVIRRVQQIVTEVSLRAQKRRAKKLNEDVEFADAIVRVREQEQKHPVVWDLPEPLLPLIRRLTARAHDPQSLARDPSLLVWKQVEVTAARTRWYPLETVRLIMDESKLPQPLRASAPREVTVEGVGLHAIGTLRRVWAEDIVGTESRPGRPFSIDDDPGGYLDGDEVGRWGIEASQERVLRGARGFVTEYLESGEQERQEPVPGRDVALTLDIVLQARLQAVLSPEFGLTQVQPWSYKKLKDKPMQPVPGENLCAAAVVLEVQSGEVLAAVSMPGVSLRQLRESPGEIWRDRLNQPYVNRAVGRAYQPGSTVKPLVWCASVAAGKVGADEIIDCKGHLFPDRPKQFRDWIYKQYGMSFGPLDGAGALARSSNYFFYTLGRRMGAKRLVEWYDRFGLGRLTGCGLDEEIRGDLPDADRASDPRARGFTEADGIFMAIGQGPMRWTPLQAANSYATLARGGRVVSPTFLLHSEAGNPHYRNEGLRISDAALGESLQGLYEAANRKYGTAHHISYNLELAPGLPAREDIFNLEGVKIMGKSGTAQAAPLRIESDGKPGITRADEVVREGDHAWFVGLVQKPGSPQPDYVIAVVVEYGGSGGKVAGPIANQILHALNAEGYL